MIIPNNVLFDDVVSMLSKGHTVTLRAKGNSMFPFIIGGRDCVVLQKAVAYRRGISCWHVWKGNIMCCTAFIT